MYCWCFRQSHSQSPITTQAVPLAIADHDANTGQLPDLRVRKQWFEPELWNWVDQANGRYNVTTHL
ncbi:MAG: hypothetical protein J7J06_03970, partial [Methanosarcinales archaeon]|nr:hypothetical protein [Methanosarcinales archaeon]